MIAVQRLEQAAGDVEEGDVVVARHGQHRKPEALQEVARRGELPATRALGQVPAHRHQVRGRLLQVVRQGGHDRRVRATEMEVRDVGDRPHAGAGGASTRSARGRTR